MRTLDTPHAAAFLPEAFDGSVWESIEPVARALLDRPVDSPRGFERWLLDRSEFDAACGESRASLYIAMTCRTDDEAASGAYAKYIDEIPPRLRPIAFDLDTKQASLHERFPLDPDRYRVLERSVRTDVALFRAENVPLMTELDRLSQEYQRLTGAMTVHFRGEERTLPQMARYQQETDRALREETWRLVSARRLDDRDALDAMFDQMIALRTRVGRNAGFDSFRDYVFPAMHRFDYTPAHCFEFHRAVEQRVVPFVRRVNERRRERLGLEALRPWDLSVDEFARPPLAPFTDGDDLVARTRALFRDLGAGLESMFESLGSNGAPGEFLDLDSRKGKAPGGYQYMRERTRRPFIFMNAAGLHRDLETMVHEAGHAFHSLLCRDEPLVAYRESPIEFAEVASMGMELLSMRAWDRFYPDASDHARAVREHLEGNLLILAWIAQIDAFQHWLYTHDHHTADQRREAWIALDERFGHRIEWQGLEDARAAQWQRQPHLFVHPFYYIEYGIAQLGALGLWLHAQRHSHASAIERYTGALALGGSKPLPELFAAAGISFDLGDATIARLVEAVEGELARLPA